MGCGWNYDQNGFDYHAGGEYDELAIWTRQLINNASLNELPFMMGGYCKYLTKENKEEGHTENLLGPDNNIEILKHFMNILLKN